MADNQDFKDIKKEFEKSRKMQEKQFAEEKEARLAAQQAEKGRAQLNKQGMSRLIGELQKTNNLGAATEKLTKKRFDDLLKGPMSKLVKSTQKNTELSKTIAGLTKEQQAQALATATAQQVQERKEQSFILRAERLLRGGLTGAERTRELTIFRQQVSEGIDGIKQRFSTFQRSLKSVLEFATNPLKLLGGIFSLLTRFIVRPFLSVIGKVLLSVLAKSGITQLLTFFGLLPLEIARSLSKTLREDSKLDRKEAARAGDRGEEADDLKETEDQRESKRLQEGMFKTMLKNSKLLGGLKDAFGKGFGKGGLGGFAKLLLGLLPIAFFGAALINGLKDGVKDFVRTGGIQSAIGEFFTGMTQVFTIGLIGKDELRERVKKPFLMFVEGITSLIDFVQGEKGFNPAAVAKSVEGGLRLTTMPLDLAFRLGTGMVEGLSRLLGADAFADQVHETFSDFKLMDPIINAVDSMVSFLTGEAKQAATTIARLDPRRTIEALRKQEDVSSLQAAVRGFEEAEIQTNFALGSLTKKSEKRKLQRQLFQIKKNKLAVLRRINELQDADINLEAAVVTPDIRTGIQIDAQERRNAALRQGAAQAVINVPVTSPTIVTGPGTPPAPLIIPVPMRNHDPTLVQSQANDFRGGMP